jgi:hypothetical protein
MIEYRSRSDPGLVSRQCERLSDIAIISGGSSAPVGHAAS